MGTYVAVQHPYMMLTVVTFFLAGFLWFAPRAFRLLRIETSAILALLKKLFLKVRSVFVRTKSRVFSHKGSGASRIYEVANDEMPAEYVYHLRDRFKVKDQTAVIKCAAGKGIRGLRHSIGYLNITPAEAIFLSKRLLRLRGYTVPRNKIEHIHFKKHLLMDRLTLRVNGKQHVFYFFKDAFNRGEAISRILRDTESLNHPTEKI